MTTHTGGCLCKGVRYELSAESLMPVSCYCRDCQQVTGSTFAINTGWEQGKRNHSE